MNEQKHYITVGEILETMEESFGLSDWTTVKNELEAMPLRVNDFFCGAGGMGLGFKQAGFRLAGAWDFDRLAVESYANNISPKVKQADITQITWEEVPVADVWTFGFPCQDISLAGKGAGMVKGQTRSGLFYEIMRLLEQTENNNPNNLPSIILAENVKAVNKYLPEIEKEYEARGYRMYSTIYNSKYWGVPQSRERCFIVGVRKDLKQVFNFPAEKKEYTPKLSELLEKDADESYYLSDEKAQKIIDQLESRNQIKGKLPLPLNLVSRGAESRGDDIAYCLKTAFCQHVLEEVGNPKVSRNTKYLVRKLTPTEMLKLQGFPSSFKQVVSYSRLEKQMGNAVTVNVSEVIARAIKEFIQRN